MICFAEKDDIPILKEMWQEIFEEDEAVCSLFFKDIFDFAPVYKVDGKIVSALFLLPCSFGEYKGFSVYCAMTEKEFRGKGYMKDLLDFSYAFAKKKQLDFLFLVPAEKSLFGYYEKCGFISFGSKQVLNSSGNAPRLSDVRACSAKEYIRLREKDAESSLSYSENIVKYWISACIHYGGEAVASGTSHALIFPDENGVILRDAYGNGIQDIIEYAKEKHPERKITAEGRLSNGSTVPCGMIRTENSEIFKNDYYIGITLE